MSHKRVTIRTALNHPQVAERATGRKGIHARRRALGELCGGISVHMVRKAQELTRQGMEEYMVQLSDTGVPVALVRRGKLWNIVKRADR